ncbi:unnamed protein product [Phytophthora fragariaefolia]|uniref:Unnamed protein product n=1 Tax=Phytophthora fragariaefolia TaxID=1490495 RepID=A0A9W6Y6Z5_9STRA|nr:unnamed protein product [Phytophthora fragariaefolia]
MGYSSDIRWRGIVLIFVYNIDVSVVSEILGVSARSLRRWYYLFKTSGNVDDNLESELSSKRPNDVQQFVREYVRQHPRFYFQQSREELKGKFVNRISCSDSTIFRALRFDLGLSRKFLTKRARESVPKERQEYANRHSGITSNVYIVLLILQDRRYGSMPGPVGEPLLLSRYHFPGGNGFQFTLHSMFLDFSRGVQQKTHSQD